MGLKCIVGYFRNYCLLLFFKTRESHQPLNHLNRCFMYLYPPSAPPAVAEDTWGYTNGLLSNLSHFSPLKLGKICILPNKKPVLHILHCDDIFMTHMKHISPQILMTKVQKKNFLITVIQKNTMNLY